MQSTIIARIAQERRVRSVRAVADHRQWTRGSAAPATAAQEQQRGRGGHRRRGGQQAEMGSAGHVVRRPRSCVQEQVYVGNI